MEVQLARFPRSVVVLLLLWDDSLLSPQLYSPVIIVRPLQPTAFSKQNGACQTDFQN